MGQPLTLRTELAETPASGDFLHVIDVSDTTDSPDGTSKKVQAQYLTISDASTTVKGKVELATDAETITGTDTVRAVTPANITAKIDTDGTFAGNSDTRIPSQKAVKTYADTKTTLSEVLSAVYPVGSVYISVVSTSPATLFGFGTWSAFAAGRTLVGIDAGQTEFDTVEETGGEKTHTLTIAEMPSHQHTSDPSATNMTGSSGHDSSGGGLHQKGPLTSIPIEGGDAAHNNLQPYIVTYMWKRTA